MWQETKDGLYKEFRFADFAEAFAFMTRVAALAEARQHHPRWENNWNTVKVWLLSHDAGDAITDKDRELASAIDKAIDESA
jgi:4a-hydroxytetrahydrobiopterin dehydratase